VFVEVIAILKDICDEFSGMFAVVGPKSRLDEVIDSFVANLPNTSLPVHDGILRLDNHHQKCLKSVLRTTLPY